MPHVKVAEFKGLPASRVIFPGKMHSLYNPVIVFSGEVSTYVNPNLSSLYTLRAIEI